MSPARSGLLSIVVSTFVRVSAEAQSAVPIISVPEPTIASNQTFGAILGLNHLPTGEVIVNDAGRRQVLKLSATLTTTSVIIDSTPGTRNSYGPRPTPLLRYLGDSSLFVDPASSSLLVIDPSGKVIRAMSPPNPNDMRFLASTPVYVDPQGRMVYRGSMLLSTRTGSAPASPQAPPSGIPAMPLLRADFDKRTVDTLGTVKSGNGTLASMVTGPDGGVRLKQVLNPLFVVDDYAVLADGSVAIVRGQDYHVDVVTPSGNTQQGKKLPFDWKRLTDEDKERLRDSVLKAPRPTPAGGGGSMPPMTVSSGGASAGGVSFTIGAGPGAATETRITPEMLSGGAASIGRAPVEVVPVKEMADYLPSIRSGAARPDLDGNLWLLPNTSAQSLNGELVYDIVDKNGTLTHRVRIPKGRSVVGFGAGGVVYLTKGDRTTGFTLEKSTVPATR